MVIRARTLGYSRPDWKHAGPRRRLYALWRAFHVLLRHGGGTRKWGSAAHGYGIAAQLQYLAGFQVGVWPLPGWHLHPVQLWHRHQIRLLAHARAASLQAIHRPVPE